MRTLWFIVLCLCLGACADNGVVEVGVAQETPPQTAEQRLETFNGLPQNTPIQSLSLIRLREQAQYRDGDQEFGTASGNVSGQVAADRYFAQVSEIIEASGGRIDFVSPIEQTFLGPDADKWDLVSLVSFPDRATFMAVVTSPDYEAVSRHRWAGIAEHHIYHLGIQPAD